MTHRTPLYDELHLILNRAAYGATADDESRALAILSELNQSHQAESVKRIFKLGQAVKQTIKDYDTFEQGIKTLKGSNAQN